MSFICGFTGNQEDDLEDLCMLPSTPQRKTTRRRSSFCSRSNKDSKNPYSNRGLDKFEALLADLDGKRQMIYTKKGSEDISLVRFMYSNSNDVKPIIVKVKHHRKQDKDQRPFKPENIKTPVAVVSSSDHLVGGGDGNVSSGDVVVQPSIGCEKMVGFDQLRRNFGEWWRPWYGLPVFVMVILVLLVFFGRSFTIFCTSIGSYMMPTINGTYEIPKRKKKTGKMAISSPRNVLKS
ncbi:hypothetical protein R6Q59_031369 [Mikania micrantha]|uniref:ZCF37 n=1 Tax=Mikania micrantha TaxID=192012 RepID=A0A5N6LCJ9_9ASTR|nr:hypothetical protein E3N88_44257 [Mikania micrantha]